VRTAYFRAISILLTTLALGLGMRLTAQIRPMEDLVVPAAEDAGTILEAELFASYSLDELRRSTPGFFEHYEVPEPVLPVQHWKLRFYSTDTDGSQVIIHAQLFVPEIDGSREFPAYVFASGTTGLSDASAPSLEIPEEERWGWYTQNMLAYAAQGFIVMFPDYTGFNDPERTQRYFSKYAEGYMMLDAIRAMNSFFDEDLGEGTGARPDGHVFTAGYSQGGHAAMAAADIRPLYSPDVPLTGVITFGSTNDVEALFREGVAYGPLILYSYREIYGEEAIDIGRYLLPRWIENFEIEAQGRLPEFQATYGFSQERVFTPEFRDALNNRTVERDFPELYALMAENHTGHSGHGLPSLIIQGGRDFIVTTATQAIFVNRLRELGSQVRFLVYPNATHRYTRHAGFRATVWWMNELSGRNN
jgi:pimeloyl-ACP methyl ester carboxylesterase